MARHVKHETTVGELRLVGNLHEGQRPVSAGVSRRAVDGIGKKLLERLQSVEETGGVGRRDLHAGFVDVEGVGFVCQRRIHGQADAGCCFRS